MWYTPGLCTTSNSNSNRQRRHLARGPVDSFRSRIHLSTWWSVRIFNCEPSIRGLDMRGDQTTARHSLCVASYLRCALRSKFDQEIGLNTQCSCSWKRTHPTCALEASVKTVYYPFARGSAKTGGLTKRFFSSFTDLRSWHFRKLWGFSLFEFLVQGCGNVSLPWNKTSVDINQPKRGPYLGDIFGISHRLDCFRSRLFQPVLCQVQSHVQGNYFIRKRNDTFSVSVLFGLP